MNLVVWVDCCRVFLSFVKIGDLSTFCVSQHCKLVGGRVGKKKFELVYWFSYNISLLHVIIIFYAINNYDSVTESMLRNIISYANII